MSETVFIVSNFQHDCSKLLAQLSGYDYIVYDQSIDKTSLENIWNKHFRESVHSGHNISDYYSFFYENYGSLPELIGLIKGNIFPRHLSEGFFKSVFGLKHYTFLYEHRQQLQYPTNGLFQHNQYYEYANNWYVKNHPHWFSSLFKSYIGLFTAVITKVHLSFFHQEPVILCTKTRFNATTKNSSIILTLL